MAPQHCLLYFRCRRKRRSFLVFTVLLLFLFYLANISPHTSQYMRRTEVCAAPNQNLMYIKMIKCASETLSSMFRRYAFTRNLSIVLPLQNKIYLGWPYAMTNNSYRPSKTGSFNFLVDHAMYNEEFMSDLMPEGTTFVTSLREPFAQFKSMFNYYRLAVVCNITQGKDPVTEYLIHIEMYEKIYKLPERAQERFCIPDGYSMSKNLMAFNLGFPAGKPDGSLDASHDQRFIDHFLASIDSKFKLVIIVEHFDESMILLRRLMCWTIKDVLYRRRNIGQYRNVAPNQGIEHENLKIYKKWSPVDYKLYAHFKGIFWDKVKQQGSGFYDELRYYKKINRNANKYCGDIESGRLDTQQKMPVEKSSYTKPFILNQDFCKMFGTWLMDEVKKQYDDIPCDVPQVLPQKEFC